MYVEPAGPQEPEAHREVVRTEQQIVDEYFEQWKQQMIRAGHKDLISEERCVEDWVVVHWAWML